MPIEITTSYPGSLPTPGLKSLNDTRALYSEFPALRVAAQGKEEAAASPYLPSPQDNF